MLVFLMLLILLLRKKIFFHSNSVGSSVRKTKQNFLKQLCVIMYAYFQLFVFVFFNVFYYFCWLLTKNRYSLSACCIFYWPFCCEHESNNDGGHSKIVVIGLYIYIGLVYSIFNSTLLNHRFMCLLRLPKPTVVEYLCVYNNCCEYFGDTCCRRCDSTSK
jgi:hypothetical protein